MHTPISQTLWNVKMLQFFGLSKAIFVVARQLSTTHGPNKRSIPSLYTQSSKDFQAFRVDPAQKLESLYPQWHSEQLEA